MVQNVGFCWPFVSQLWCYKGRPCALYFRRCGFPASPSPARQFWDGLGWGLRRASDRGSHSGLGQCLGATNFHRGQGGNMLCKSIKIPKKVEHLRMEQRFLLEVWWTFACLFGYWGSLNLDPRDSAELGRRHMRFNSIIVLLRWES